MGRLKAKRPPRRRITHLELSSGRIVTDPDEIRVLLAREGLVVDRHGNVRVARPN